MYNNTIVLFESVEEMSKKLGLALGAGSARGLAHIGVLQVLEEEGIPVSMIAGSSMGAVVGSIYACGTDIHMLQKVVASMNEKDYFDFVMPRKGFIRGAKFKDLLAMFTKQMDFEDTVIPFACVATDVIKGKTVVLDKGSISESVRASFAIPGVFEPHIIDGVTLVDGGVLDRMPGETVKSMGADIVVGVDVGFRGGPGLELTCDTLMNIITNCLDIMQWEITQKADVHCDLIITPKVQHINPNSSAQSDECVERGRQATILALPKIRELMGI